MKITKVYVTCDTPDVVPLKDAAQVIALQRGCDPVRVPWPLEVPEESGEERGKYECELWACQKQFRGIISECDLFIAIVGKNYGKIRVSPPITAEGEPERPRISSMHWEILQALGTSGKKPEVMVFKPQGIPVRAVGEMLLAVPERLQTEFVAETQFKTFFSKKLSEHKELSLAQYLAGLGRLRISITCNDRVGLLAALAEVIRRMKGNLAEGSQVTKGRLAILQFVAEWPGESCPREREVEQALREAFVALQSQVYSQAGAGNRDPQIEVTSVSGRDSEFDTLMTFMVTFIDQPGIASYIFNCIKEERESVLSTQIQTFLSGGMMLGRARFGLRGDGFSSARQNRFVRELKKLPGILHVDSSALRGRFWA